MKMYFMFLCQSTEIILRDVHWRDICHFVSVIVFQTNNLKTLPFQNSKLYSPLRTASGISRCDTVGQVDAWDAHILYERAKDGISPSGSHPESS